MSSQRKKAKKIFEGKEKKQFPITIILVGVIIVGLIITGILTNGFNLFENKNSDNEESDVVVRVNNEVITQADLDKQWNILPAQTKAQTSKEEILDELVSETLLLQRAQELNISINLTEVEYAISMQLNQLGSSVEEYKETLQAQGIVYEDILRMYQRQFIIATLFEEETNAQDLSVSEEEIQTFYSQHPEEFFQEEKVKVRHILIEINDEVNESQAHEQSKQLLDQILENESIFCDIVLNYSMDSGSVSNCGEYSFSKGMMVEEFENASFEMGVGEYEIVQTIHGFHIINKLEDISSGTLRLDDEIVEMPGMHVRDVIEQMLLEQKAKQIFDTYMNTIEENADIEYK